MATYKILTKRGAKAILTKLDELDCWKPGVSASYCPSDSLGGHNYEIHAFDNKVVGDLAEALAKTIVNKRKIRIATYAILCMPPKFNKYYGGGEYKSHVDAAFVGPHLRTDYAVTLMLSDTKDYEGGELWVGGKLHKPEQGYCVVYPCGQPHHVTPVTKGERICAVTWIQSSVKDPYKRELLQKFQQLMLEHESDPETFTKIGEIFYSLQKMWMSK